MLQELFSRRPEIGHNERYSTPDEVYFTTNETHQEVCKSLRQEEGMGRIRYVGVLGGLDASLSHLAALEQATGTSVEKVALTDINSFAVNMANTRLDIIRAVETPMQYIENLIPGNIDLDSLRGIDDEDELYRRISQLEIEFDDNNIRATLARIGYDDRRIDEYIDGMLQSNHNTTFQILQRRFTNLSDFLTRKPKKFELGVDMSILLTKAILQKEHWLSLENQDNYSTVRGLVSEDRVAIINTPIQALDDERIKTHLENEPINYLYLSNVNGFMGNRDFRRMLDHLDSPSDYLDTSDNIDPRIIFVDYGGTPDEFGNNPNRMIRASEREHSTMLRPDRERFDDILKDHV